MARLSLLTVMQNILSLVYGKDDAALRYFPSWTSSLLSSASDDEALDSMAVSRAFSRPVASLERAPRSMPAPKSNAFAANRAAPVEMML